MDISSAVVQLCIEGTQAEYAGKHDQASTLYWHAWQAAKDDFDLCIAAHYVARFQTEPDEIFHWNLEALTHANLVKDERVNEFYPSLYLNMGRSYELLGNQNESKRYYDLAAGLGYLHQP